MTFRASGVVLAGMACIALAIAGCQKDAASAPNGAANAVSPMASAAPPATAPSVASNLPAECQALLAALQSCSDHLSAANSPVAAQFRQALQQTRETMPAAAADPTLAGQCAQSLQGQTNTARELNC